MWPRRRGVAPCRQSATSLDAETMARSRDPMSWVALGQGAFYAVTGTWPLLSMRTFLAVTGPKTDLWLVKTVGALLVVIGLTLGLDGLGKRVSPGTLLLGTGSALGLGAIDVVYVHRRQISRVYLLDALAELALLAAWWVAASAGARRAKVLAPERRAL